MDRTSKRNGLYMSLHQKRLVADEKLHKDGLQKRASRQLVRSRRAVDWQREQVLERDVEERDLANKPQVKNLEDLNTVREEEEYFAERAGESIINGTEENMGKEENLLVLDRIIGGVETRPFNERAGETR